MKAFSLPGRHTSPFTGWLPTDTGNHFNDLVRRKAELTLVMKKFKLITVKSYLGRAKSQTWDSIVRRQRSSQEMSPTAPRLSRTEHLLVTNKR